MLFSAFLIPSIVAILIVSVGCAASTTSQSAAYPSQEPKNPIQATPNRMPALANCGDRMHPPCHPEVRVGKYGIGCKTVASRTTVGPASYNVSDIGKSGVPQLTPGRIALARRIQRYTGSRTLRFAIGPFGPWRRTAPIVFDATEGPCFDGAPGYLVLNDSDGNTFYEPGEAPGYIHPGPGDIRATPGPWCHHRTGVAPCD